MRCSNLMTLFGGRKRPHEGDSDETPPGKKIKLENIPLSNIRYYKKQIYLLICKMGNPSPTQILIQLLLNTADVNNRENKVSPHLEFEKKLLKALGYPVNDQLINLISIINVYLQDLQKLPQETALKLQPEDNLFGLLIAYFYYYIDYYRINFNPDLQSFPFFKEKIFIPLEIYKRQYIAKQDSQVSVLISAEIFWKIEERIKKNISHIYYFDNLKIFPLTDKQKEMILKRLVEKVTEEVTKKEKPNIIKFRKLICAAIRTIEAPADIENYLHHVAFVLYQFPSDQFVRKTGCQLLAKVFSRVSKDQANDILVKLISSLSEKTALVEKEGACIALSSMRLSREQVDKVFPVLFDLCEINNTAQRHIHDIQAIFSMDLTDEQFTKILNLGSLKLVDDSLKLFISFINLKERNTGFYEKLIDWLLQEAQQKRQCTHFQCYLILESIPIPKTREKEVLEYMSKSKNLRFLSLHTITDPVTYKAYAWINEPSTYEKVFTTACNALTINSQSDDYTLPACMLSSLNLSSDTLSQLKEIISKNFKCALQYKKLWTLIASWEVVEKLSLDIDEVNNTALTSDNCSLPTLLAIQALKKCSINIGFKEMIILDRCFHLLSETPRNDFVSAVNGINFKDERKNQDECNKLLVQYLILFLNLAYNECILRAAIYEMVQSLLISLNQSYSEYFLTQFILDNEIKIQNLKTYFLNSNSPVSETSKLFSTLHKIIKHQMIPNESFNHCNLLCRFEWENENNGFSLCRQNLIHMLREETAAVVSLSLVAHKNEVPLDIVPNIKRFRL